MRAQVMKRCALAALLAVTLSGCTEMPTGMAWGDYGAFPSNSLVGNAGPKGGGGNPTAEIAGATSLLFQTSIGPVVWKGVQLAKLESTAPRLLWNAPPDRNNQALAIPQEGRAWAVGYGVARYRDGEWDTEATDVDAVASPTAAADQRLLLTDVSFASGSTTVGYAVGTRGTILTYVPGVQPRWARLSVDGLGTANLGTVKVFAPNDVWVAGQVLLHYDGSAWTKHSAVPGDVSGLALDNENNVWASTGSGLYKWVRSTGQWSDPFTLPGHAIGAPQIESFNGTVVGLALEPGVPGGAVFTLRNGAWQTETVTVPADVGLDSVAIASATTAYAKTYDNSGVYRFDIPTKQWFYYSE